MEGGASAAGEGWAPTIGFPHSLQNFAPSGCSLPHDEQNMTSPLFIGAVHAAQTENKKRTHAFPLEDAFALDFPLPDMKSPTAVRDRAGFTIGSPIPGDHFSRARFAASLSRINR
jgi:hypothetical protein